MAGRFEGYPSEQWAKLEDLFLDAFEKRGKGMPHAPFRKVINTLLYILITGYRWCDKFFCDALQNSTDVQQSALVHHLIFYRNFLSRKIILNVSLINDLQLNHLKSNIFM